MEADCAFANLDQYMATCYIATLGEVFFLRSVDAREILARLMRYNFSPSMLYKFLSNKSADRSNLGMLSALPTEILSMIFDHLDVLSDAICFALTNSILLHVGAHRINFLLGLEEHASWRGDRIIFLAHEVPDAPKGLFTAEELDDLGTWGFKDIWGNMGEHDTYRSAYPIAPDDRYRNMCEFDQVLYWTILWHQLRQDTPVLMNLSKRVYVVETTIKSIARPFDIGLDNVLLARICWTFEEPGRFPEYDPPVKRGSWAGDRFVVEDKSCLDHCIDNGEEWTDVSDDIGKELLTYWTDHSDRFGGRPSRRNHDHKLETGYSLDRGQTWLLEEYKPRKFTP
ncbi:hypothetical protein HGRIS_005945 [Hohenbuehelia grisea]|uniref:F-box domain-containing protein n=1 Tax=Hohenbuehelia grisea TaxID=104357 RepID=A0ABR3K0I6_9AGAR